MGKAKNIDSRADYVLFRPLSTRWLDNDVYGHINNVHYYAFFDSVVNQYLVESGVLDIQAGETVAWVVSSGCDYHAALAWPQAIEAGLRVEQLGRSSVRYGIGIFAVGEARAAAQGFFVHVFVERASGRPVAMPAAARAALQSLQRTPG